MYAETQVYNMYHVIDTTFDQSEIQNLLSKPEVRETDAIGFMRCTFVNDVVVDGHFECILFIDCTFSGKITANARALNFIDTLSNVELSCGEDNILSIIPLFAGDYTFKVLSDVKEMKMIGAFNTNKLLIPEFANPAALKQLKVAVSTTIPFSMPEIPFFALTQLTIKCHSFETACPWLDGINFTILELNSLINERANDQEKRAFYCGQLTLEQINEYYAMRNRGGRVNLFVGNTQTVHIQGLEDCFKKEIAKMQTEYAANASGFSPVCWLKSVGATDTQLSIIQRSPNGNREIISVTNSAIYKAYCCVSPDLYLDWVSRLCEELEDGKGMCVPGRVSRIVNSFIGLSDKTTQEDIVVVRLSRGESIGNYASLISKKMIGRPTEEIKKAIYDDLIERGYSEEDATTWSSFI